MAINYRGTVKLVNGNVTIHSFQYTSREERNSIIDRWKKICKGYFHCYNVQIVPAIVGDAPKPKRKTKTERLKVMQEESRERYDAPVRHKAVYTNLRVYDYDKPLK